MPNFWLLRGRSGFIPGGCGLPKLDAQFFGGALKGRGTHMRAVGNSSSKIIPRVKA